MDACRFTSKASTPARRVARFEAQRLRVFRHRATPGPPSRASRRITNIQRVLRFGIFRPAHMVPPPRRPKAPVFREMRRERMTGIEEAARHENLAAAIEGEIATIEPPLRPTRLFEEFDSRRRRHGTPPFRKASAAGLRPMVSRDRGSGDGRVQGRPSSAVLVVWKGRCSTTDDPQLRQACN
jgi:hypothetical protein